MKERMPMKCRKCGERVAVITWGVYRKAVVNPGAVMVIPQDGGEEFVRVDGSKSWAGSRHTRKTENRRTGCTGRHAGAEDEVQRVPGGAEIRGGQRILRILRDHYQR